MSPALIGGGVLAAVGVACWYQSVQVWRETRRLVDSDVPDERDSSTVLARVQCPDCGDIVPIGVQPGEMVDGNLEVEADLSDVWAHRFNHEETDR